MELYDPSGNVISSETQVKYAGFWIRFGAYFLDSLIIGIPLFIISHLLYGGARLPTLLTNGIVQWLYFALLESGPGMATLGKKALELKVTDINGGRITFAQASGRYFAKILSSIILLIGFLMMLWSDKRQALHDQLANTVVISK